MIVKEIWNGREIVGDDPELRKHQEELVQNFFNALWRADVDKAKRLFHPVKPSGAAAQPNEETNK